MFREDRKTFKTKGKGMTDNYNKTSERLYEKLLFHKVKFDPDSIDLKKPFPMDQLTPNNELIKLVREVQEEFNYEMSEFQCSWAVVMAFNPSLTIEDIA